MGGGISTVASSSPLCVCAPLALPVLPLVEPLSFDPLAARPLVDEPLCALDDPLSLVSPDDAFPLLPPRPLLVPLAAAPDDPSMEEPLTSPLPC